MRRKPPATATPWNLWLPRQSPTLPVWAKTPNIASLSTGSDDMSTWLHGSIFVSRGGSVHMSVKDLIELAVAGGARAIVTRNLRDLSRMELRFPTLRL